MFTLASQQDRLQRQRADLSRQLEELKKSATAAGRIAGEPIGDGDGKRTLRGPIDLRTEYEGTPPGWPEGYEEIAFNAYDWPACDHVAEVLAWTPGPVQNNGPDLPDGVYEFDGRNSLAINDRRSTTAQTRAADSADLIARLEDDYSLPGHAAGPLSTSIEWEEIKRRLTGIAPIGW